jgi:hypothetical protein
VGRLSLGAISAVLGVFLGILATLNGIKTNLFQLLPDGMLNAIGASIFRITHSDATSTQTKCELVGKWTCTFYCNNHNPGAATIEPNGGGFTFINELGKANAANQASANWTNDSTIAVLPPWNVLTRPTSSCRTLLFSNTSVWERYAP